MLHMLDVYIYFNQFSWCEKDSGDFSLHVAVLITARHNCSDKAREGLVLYGTCPSGVP